MKDVSGGVDRKGMPMTTRFPGGSKIPGFHEANGVREESIVKQGR